MGGGSAEREISLRSGTAVFNALKTLNYDVVSIDAGPDICETLRRNKIEIAFLALHGGYGEDGSIQGLLEVNGISYTGSGVLASALAMDKEASKKIFLYHNIPAPPYVVAAGSGLNAMSDVSKSDMNMPSYDSCLRLAGFSMPWVVKPLMGGSSVGISIVKDELNVEPALEKAFMFGQRVIIEKYITGREIHVGILNDRVLGAVEVRPGTEFYSYEAKYTSGLTEYILPPDMPAELSERTWRTALSAHNALGCRGATRVDLIVDAGGNPFVLEVNTIPGMTETSLLPKIAGLSGLDFPSLTEEILKDAVVRAGKA